MVLKSGWFRLFSTFASFVFPSCCCASWPLVSFCWLLLTFLSFCSRRSSHLSLREAESHRQLRLPPHGDVAVALKLLLQLLPLVVGVHHPVLVLRSGLPSWSWGSGEEKKHSVDTWVNTAQLFICVELFLFSCKVAETNECVIESHTMQRKKNGQTRLEPSSTLGATQILISSINQAKPNERKDSSALLLLITMSRVCTVCFHRRPSVRWHECSLGEASIGKCDRVAASIEAAPCTHTKIRKRPSVCLFFFLLNLVCLPADFRECCLTTLCTHTVDGEGGEWQLHC